MKTKEDPIVWKKNAHYIFETFAVELKEFTQTGIPPAHGSQDVQYALELQKKRLKDKQLIMKYDFVPRGHFPGSSPVTKIWRDDRYTSRMEFRTCRLTKKIYHEQTKVYEEDKNFIFYQTITDANNHTLVAHDIHSCPNCGATSKIAILEKGCPYCGTFFKMSDLFPKTTNFYFIEDSGGTETELKNSLMKFILPCAIISIIGLFVLYSNDPEMNYGIILTAISALLGGCAFGAFTGYLMWAFLTLGSLFKNAGKALPKLFNIAGSGKRFVSLMKQYSPNFSFEYFSGKVVSILKMILFASDARELSYYIGKPLGNVFADIIDSSYSGGVALKRFSVKDGYCYVTVETYMEDLYEVNGRIHEKEEMFRIDLCKNIRKPINLHFSIKAMQCSSCGSSFDATKQKCCPRCSTAFALADEDWVVTGIQKR